MTITVRVLGCEGAFPKPGRPCSGYLVTSGEAALLVDVGFGVWPALLDIMDPAALSGIWISHLHPDHTGDLLAAYQWRANTAGTSTLPVVGPPGWASRIGSALPVARGEDELRQMFHVHEHSGRAPRVLGPFDLAAISVQHSVPTWGLRIETNGQTLAYSGDSGPCEALRELADGAGIFICEAGSPSLGQSAHCAPEDAARMAVGAQRLLVTHLAPGLKASEASRRAGGAEVARPGLLIEL